jgi:hypothetical protein
MKASIVAKILIVVNQQVLTIVQIQSQTLLKISRGYYPGNGF